MDLQIPRSMGTLFMLSSKVNKTSAPNPTATLLLAPSITLDSPFFTAKLSSWVEYEEGVALEGAKERLLYPLRSAQKLLMHILIAVGARG